MTDIDKLRAIYLKAETDIVNEIGRLRSMGLADYHAVAALERVQNILAKMQDDAFKYIPQMIEKEFYARNAQARKILEPVEKHVQAYKNAMTITQRDLADRLINNLMDEISVASNTVYQTLTNALIGRKEKDIFRQAGIEMVAYQQAVGGRAGLDNFVQALAREGVTAFVDKAGRKWSLHTYADMVSRTTARQAEITAVLAADPEHDLYKISSHGTTCKICAPFEGRVYSRSGTNPDFPPLASAFGKIDPNGSNDLSNTWLNIHPNCLHVLIPWTEAGRSEKEIQEAKDFSNPKKNPFSVDPRSQAQVDAYRNKEKARAKWLNDYRQWERYRMTLGDTVPKSFTTWEKHKKADDEKFKIWKLDYKRQKYLAAHPESALPNAKIATAADNKFIKYFFNPNNKAGYAKGVAFSSRLGYNINNWEMFRDEILEAATKYPAKYKLSNEHGDKYSQLVVLQGLKNNPANIILGWLVSPNGTTHLTTAHMEDV